MEESIKVQEEFENLIEQLENLKNINELTSANTESAKQVIKQIDSFILSTNEFKKKIEEDLSLKSQSIEKLILHLEKSIDAIEHQSQSLSKNIESLFGIFKNETGDSFNSLSEVVSNKIEFVQKAIIDLKDSFYAKSDNSENKLIESFTKQINALTSEVNENKIAIANNQEAQYKEIKSLKTVLFIICGLVVIGTVVTISILK